MRFLVFLSFFLISCGGGSDNAPIKDSSVDIDENSSQDSIRINKSISTSGEEDNIEVTINKDWIRDANGNQMTSDFSFSFNVDSTLQNPGCPPAC